jgi:hypothetical protein
MQLPSLIIMLISGNLATGGFSAGMEKHRSAVSRPRYEKSDSG